MKRLIPVDHPSHIPERYRNTPIEDLVCYQNLEKFIEPFDTAKILVSMCMDNRKHLRIPENFAYIIRTGGANLRYSEFKVSYSIAIGGIRHIALIGHDNCGMVNLLSKRERFIQNLVENAGWERQNAIDHFLTFAPMFEIGNETDFVLSEAKRLRMRYPTIMVAPLMYLLDSNKICFLKED
jgi:carbonic anhydrase